MKSTTKKVKYVGTEKFINVTTGELEEMHVTSIEDRDFNFSKVWMKSFIATMNIVGNQKTKFCFWLIDHINKENIIIGTQRTLSAQSGVSYQTVNATLRLLLDADFLRKVQNGVYIVNPDVVFKGPRPTRLNILNTYSTANRIRIPDEERLTNILSSIKTLQQQANQLQYKITEKRKTQAQTDIYDFINNDDNDQEQQVAEKSNFKKEGPPDPFAALK